MFSEAASTVIIKESQQECWQHSQQARQKNWSSPDQCLEAVVWGRDVVGHHFSPGTHERDAKFKADYFLEL